MPANNTQRARKSAEEKLNEVYSEAVDDRFSAAFAEQVMMKKEYARKAARKASRNKTVEKKTPRSSLEKYIEHDEEEIVEEVKNESVKNTYQLFISLDKDDMADFIEYCFLLREIYGLDGFLRDVKDYKSNLMTAWKSIDDSGLRSLFRGRGPGFCGKWLTETMHGKIVNQDEEVIGKFFTMLNIAPWYRLQIINGKKHSVMLAGTVEESIALWLKEE